MVFVLKEALGTNCLRFQTSHTHLQKFALVISPLCVETLGHLQYKQKVFTEVALGKRPLLERTAFDFDTILLGVAGILQGN